MDLSEIVASLPIDWTSLEQSAAGTLVAGLMPVLQGEAEDVKQFGFSIAKHMIVAIKNGTSHEELNAQIKGLAEIARIRTEAVDWDLAERIVGLVFRAFTGAISAFKP